MIEFPQWIDKLYVLKNLGIYDLKLEHLPDVVTRIRSLEVLSLDGNNLITLPNSIDNLRALKELWAEANCFEHIPESFGNLIHLERVNFGVNKIKYLPESICNLTKLKFFSVSENNIQELPSNIGRLSRLTNLNISYNEITTLPRSFSKLNIKNLEVWFNGNPYNEATKRHIKILFPEIDDLELEFDASRPEDEETLISKKIEASSIETREKEANKGCNPLILIIIAVIVFVFFTIMLNKEDPLTKVTKKASREYNTVFTLYEKNLHSILKNNSYIYVYTNDTSQLKATLKPNIEFYTNSYAPYYSNTQSKTDALKKFLKDKSLGYNVVLDNNRVKLIQATVFDSIFAMKSIKKYSLVVDYKMSEKEIEIKKKHQSKYLSILDKDKDTVFNSEKIVLTSKELADRKINGRLRRVLSPIIDLDNKEYHFYFSPYDNNSTKQEFIEAVEDFKAMFLKTNTNKNLGTIKELIFETKFP